MKEYRKGWWGKGERKYGVEGLGSYGGTGQGSYNTPDTLPTITRASESHPCNHARLMVGPLTPRPLQKKKTKNKKRKKKKKKRRGIWC